MKESAKKERSNKKLLARISEIRNTPTAYKKDMDLVLSSMRWVPVSYWEPLFFFKGARDLTLRTLSKDVFPAKIKEDSNSHPLLSLNKIEGERGFQACPCSSRMPFNVGDASYIDKGCVLEHTQWEMDRRSFIVDKIIVPITPDIARKLRFWGEVPTECLRVIHRAAK